MKDFNKIFIQGKVHDLIIKDGNKLSITYASYCVKNGCLYVLPYDDVIITVPVKKYVDISVLTTAGDCSIDFNEASIGSLTFDSDCGDLVIHAEVDELSFNSSGEVLARKDSPIRQMVKCVDWDDEDDERSDLDAI